LVTLQKFLNGKHVSLATLQKSNRKLEKMSILQHCNKLEKNQFSNIAKIEKNVSIRQHCINLLINYLARVQIKKTVIFAKSAILAIFYFAP